MVRLAGFVWGAVDAAETEPVRGVGKEGLGSAWPARAVYEQMNDVVRAAFQSSEG